MGFVSISAQAAGVATFGLFKFKPEYLVLQSIFLTFFSLFFTLAFSYTFWTIVIYRNTFDPLLEIPGVPVSQPIIPKLAKACST
jgi:hypothetical protein